MHISFSKNDSLYKIFKILKKVPPYKQVTISIEKNHELFEHKWWAQQLVELLNQHHISATFIVKNTEQEEYFSAVGLPVSNTGVSGIRGVVDSIKKFLFSTKSVHRQLLAKKNVPGYLIVATEIAVLIVVGSFFWGLVSPKASITITPSHDIVPIVYQYGFHPAGTGASTTSILHEKLTIPYHIGSIPYNQEMTIDVQEITYEYTPTNGQVEFYNMLPDPISLVGGTQLVTTGGVLYTLDRWVSIPGGSAEDPGIVRGNVTARDYTEQGLPIGVLGNIELGKELLIKNLEESYIDKKITASAVRGFTNGTTVGKGTVIQEDIEVIEETILASMEKNKKSHLQEQFTDFDEVIILPFEELINFDIQEFISTATVGDNTTFVDGTVNATLYYAYIYVDDFYTGVENFIKKRPPQGQFLIDYDPHSITFYGIRRDEENENYFTIPVKVNTIWGYNFSQDNYGLGKEMINNVKELSRRDAKKLLLDYNEVRDATIKLSPPWYDTLPVDPQRIIIKTTLQ